MATPDMLAAADTTIDWKISAEPVDYADALQQMEERAAQIADGEANDLIWLLEHPPLYTAGTSAREEDMLNAKFPVHKAGRGGQFTYHGPGQRVAYLMLDLKARRQDIRWYIHELEQWIIDALSRFQVVGERREGRVGIWIDRGRFGGREGQEDKIAAIGVRVRRWVTMHGISINVDPQLSHFDGIVPCGIREHGVTSLVDLGLPVTIEDMDIALRETLPLGLANRQS